jgi:8-oxo-dGTP pyrophosphatase MutT (NUDIX family)
MKIFLEERVIEFLHKEPVNSPESDLIINSGNSEEIKATWLRFEADPSIWNLRILIREPNSSTHGITGKKAGNLLSLFKIIEAGGGLIKNEMGSYLFIFRYGKWDLPKGKVHRHVPQSVMRNSIASLIDPAMPDLPSGNKLEKTKKLFKGKLPVETPEEAAVREIREETGLNNMKITRKLDDTFHIYYKGGKRILKRTYWYEMFAQSNQKLVPEIGEGISLVKWISPEEIHAIAGNTYASVWELLKNNCS